ncbi:uncharacterized protein BO72DRAFT_390525 [Aspergillus fijiensis CBS 313.89]|uniref:Uncharacterized protein n=1 Tax=Aspergillus fijiensis CBS 313.89 TaxID=1448319 RepID=A0A8G1RDY3_9EURO|nr:uncharacterized protein BO72DRAFT_390525 [Aspergillus fijiensis CBS 313.89]RAK72037.1 hypothetical protein BO72DRAFT_390525 [Aspergillus fijiensis CBS 313.89]
MITSKPARSRDRPCASHFEFISVVGDNVAGDAATRRRVRSHAMVDYRRRTAKPKRKETIAIEFDTNPLLQGSASLPLPFSPPLHEKQQSCTNGSSTQQLTVRIVYDGTCSMFRTMLDIGFLDVVRETIALSQLLSASSKHLGHLYADDSSTDHYRYTVHATTLLQQRLGDPATCVSDEVVVAVLAFCSFERSHKWSIPVDVNGAYIQDSMPRYQQPLAILAGRSKLTMASYQFDLSLEGGTNRHVFVSYIRQSLGELHMIMLSELMKRDLWSDVLFPGFHISPILHILLSHPRATVHDTIELRVMECFRLATVVYLTELRGRFGLDTVPGLLYGSKLHLLLHDMTLSLLSTSHQIYLVWALTVGSCASCLSEELQGSFVGLLRKMIVFMGVAEFTDYQDLIGQFLRIPDALFCSLDALEDQLFFP